MVWKDITAAERAAYKPITGRLLEKYRLRDRDIRHNLLTGTMAASVGTGVTNGVNEDTWIDMGVFKIWVAEYHSSGEGGVTTLKLRTKLTTQGSAAGSDYTVKWRLKHNGDVSNEISKTDSGVSLKTFDREEFTLTFTPSPPAGGSVENFTAQAQASIDEGTVQITWIFDDTHEGLLSTV